MLSVSLPEMEMFDEETEEFRYVRPTELRLEHSLVSLAKWESRWKKPFLNREGHNREETLDYVRCMTLTQNVDPLVYLALPESVVSKIADYVNESMTATTVGDIPGARPNREIMTAEVIYYYMIAYGIPFECQKWHLSRLFTLIRVCSVKNTPPKKMPINQVMQRNKALNEARKRKFHTRG